MLSIRPIIIPIVITIALVEFLIMTIFYLFPFFSPAAEVFIDVLLLSSLSAPIIYAWIIKPYVVAQQEATETISHLAAHDPLTDLANRRLLYESLEKLLSSLARHKMYAAILYIDLNKFKIINDQDGHDVGDVILQQTAERLSHVVRQEDLASRIGGDEFVLLLTQLGKNKNKAISDTVAIADKVKSSIKQPIEINNKSYSISASIGVRILTPEDKEVDQVLKEADEAMYSSKKV
ncbi:MAG: GGDEF domain-containing protein [Enterobacterales bacterium]|nr:GGDEF domain-containing protein [Enterobacterales bacterium]